MKSRTLFMIFLIPLALFGLAVLLIWIPLPEPFPQSLDDSRSQFAAAVIGVLSFVYIVGVIRYVVKATQQHDFAIQNLLNQMGFKSHDELIFGKKYFGTLGGYEVRIATVPPNSLNRMQLLIKVKCGFPSPLALTRGKPLLSKTALHQIQLVDVSFGEFDLYVQDEQSASELLARPKIKKALNDLVTSPHALGIKEIHLDLDEIWLRARPQVLEQESIQHWITALTSLADSAKHCEDKEQN